MYVEIAKGAPSNRGTLVPKNELHKYIEQDIPLYRSLYLYDDNAVEEIQDKGSVSNYYGTRFIDKVLIDIDKGQDTNDQTLKNARNYLMALENEGLNLKNAVQVYFSGSGYHFILPNSIFNFQASPELPYIVRKTMASLLPGIDEMVYIRSAIYRLPHTINLKTNLYKIPLTVKELMNKSADDIMKLAKTPRIEFQYTELFGDGEFEHLVIEEAPSVQEFKTVVENSNVVPCIQRMLKNGPDQGCRNNTIMRIASHFRRHGVPSEYAKVSMLHWNNNSLEDNVVIDKVEQTYNRGYQYGCQDELMAKYCQTKCVFFKRKDYMIDVKNSENLQEEFHERMTTDFNGRCINLSKMLGLPPEIDSTIYPGELVTIFGPTGSNKTTLAQNLALGVDFVNDKIVKEWQIPTLFLSLELSAWYMHRRHMQIVSGMSKEMINHNYKELYAEHKDELSHLAIQTVSPTLEQIKDKIRDLQPSVVIVDYIDLVETPPHVKGEYEQIKYVSHNLSNMAVNLDIIIIQVSQVSREYSRNDVLDLYAGKGSGAIENASRKVIGLNGQAKSNRKTVEMYKNTDGELFKTEVEWRPSFRLRRIND